MWEGGSGGGWRCGGGEGESFFVGTDDNAVACFNFSANDFLGNGVLEESFDSTAKGAGAVDGFVAFFDEEGGGFGIEFDEDPFFFEATGDFRDFEGDDFA